MTKSQSKNYILNEHTSLKKLFKTQCTTDMSCMILHVCTTPDMYDRFL